MIRINRCIKIINLILVLILIISFIAVINIDVMTHTLSNKNVHLLTYLNSNYIEKVNFIEDNIETDSRDNKSEKIKVEEQKKNTDNKNIIDTKKKETTNIKVENNQKSKVSEKKQQEIKKEEVLEKLTGALAGYGPDCAGCTTFKTASGRYIGDGQIYYEDKDYGKIRIVAGDKSYPFGTIVRISNTNYGDNAPIYAIVLDRGGGVGIGKQFLFDLLFATEKEAAKAGSRKDVIFEILRLGY